MATSFVYVIGVSQSPVKIGTAVVPRERLSQLQMGSPETLVLHEAIQVPFHVAGDVESAAHRALVRHHRRGEWFNVDAADAAAVIRQVARPIVDAAAARLDRRGDSLTTLAFDLEIGSEEMNAIAEYQRFLASDKPQDRKVAGHINALVMEREGIAALQVFRIVVAERKSLNVVLGRDPVALRNAKRALVRAVHVVTNYLAMRRTEAYARLVDKIQKSAA